MSSRSKGRKRELDCKKLLERGGWLVHLTDMPHKWKKQMDMFGVFDIIALKSGQKRFIQVKSGSTQGCKKVLKSFKSEWLEPKDIVEIWVWKKRKGFQIVGL